jgi:hypothetical protein
MGRSFFDLDELSLSHNSLLVVDLIGELDSVFQRRTGPIGVLGVAEVASAAGSARR